MRVGRIARRGLGALVLGGAFLLSAWGANDARIPLQPVAARTIAQVPLERAVTARPYTPPARYAQTRTPILMYHHVGEQEDRFTVSPRRLRAQIERLCDDGYTLQTFAQYARGDAPSDGRAAAVLTFDDGTEDQFRHLPDGRIDPASAVGVLETVRRTRPACGVTATFFVNAQTERGLPAFEQPGTEGKKLRWLGEHGYEIGSHGMTHRDYRHLTAVQARADAHAFRAWVRELAPSVRVESFAYPFGAIPKATVTREIDRAFPYTAHAWGGVAPAGVSRLVPRIETGPRTVLARYAPARPTVPAPVQIASALPSAPETSRIPHGNAYKGSAVLATYARHDPQLPPQPPRLYGQPDDHRGGRGGEPRAGLEARREESRLLDRQEGYLRRGALDARELRSAAGLVRDRYAWSSDRRPSHDPVILEPVRPKPPALVPYVPRIDPPEPIADPAPVVVTQAPVAAPKPLAWYDMPITHSTVSAVIAARQRPWWRF